MQSQQAYNYETPTDIIRHRPNGTGRSQVYNPVEYPSKDRLVFETLRVLKGLTVSEIVRGTEKSSKKSRPVCYNTVRKWYIAPKDGGTMYPRANTMDRVLQAHGYELKVAKIRY